MTETKTKEFNLTWLPKKAFEIVATLPWEEIRKTEETVVAKASQTLEIKGFRKGKAPEKMVREALGRERLLELTLQEILPGYFEKAIRELAVRPMVTPKIELLSTKENEDWQVKFTSCAEPDINLNQYKEEIKKQGTAEKIWTPGKEEPAKKEEETRDEKLNRAISWLAKNVKVEICDLLLDEEVGRRLAGLLDQIQKLGLSLEQYLSSSGKTVEQIREEYRRSAEENLSLEFILNKIAEEEKISVEPGEIEKVIAGAKTEEEKKALESQKYYLATLLRRQKTLDFLASL